MTETEKQVDDLYDKSDEAAKAEFISACLALPSVRAVSAKVDDALLTQMLSEICALIECEDLELDEEMGEAHK